MGNGGRRLKRSPRRDARMLESLRLGSSIDGAARAAGYSPTRARQYRKDDPQLEQDVQEALAEGTARIEDEALRRAVEGVDKPVFYKGEECGVVREYSDSLITFLLKARLPEKYRERSTVEHTGSITYEQAVKQFNGEEA